MQHMDLAAAKHGLMQCMGMKPLHTSKADAVHGHGAAAELVQVHARASIRGDASRFKHIVSHMVATRGAREGTLGAPLVATGRRGKFWGPSLIATFTFRFCTKGSMEKSKSKKKERKFPQIKGASPRERHLPPPPMQQ
eukprot:1161227-Pelagomonas_calceolata.AAC.2